MHMRMHVHIHMHMHIQGRASLAPASSGLLPTSYFPLVPCPLRGLQCAAEARGHQSVPPTPPYVPTTCMHPRAWTAPQNLLTLT